MACNLTYVVLQLRIRVHQGGITVASMLDVKISGISGSTVHASKASLVMESPATVSLIQGGDPNQTVQLTLTHPTSGSLQYFITYIL